MNDSSAALFDRIAAGRRSVYAYLDDPVPRPVIEHAIGVAMLAPNHHGTHPWRFFVYAGAGRERLATAYEAAARRLDRDVVKARQRALAAPAMIVTACVPALAHPKVKVGEEEFATAAAVQNLLLALTSAGVATLITTGDLAESAEVRSLVGLEEGTGKVMAVVNAGYADPRRRLPERPQPDIASLTTWCPSA